MSINKSALKSVLTFWAIIAAVVLSFIGIMILLVEHPNIGIPLLGLMAFVIVSFLMYKNYEFDEDIEKSSKVKINNPNVEFDGRGFRLTEEYRNSKEFKDLLAKHHKEITEAHKRAMRKK